MESHSLHFDVVVIGGGIGGICAALSSARHGMQTVLIHNRSVLGGNASSEVRVHIGGATEHGYRFDSRESGIIEELRLEIAVKDPRNEYRWIDTVLYSICCREENLKLLLNCHAFKLKTDEDRIKSVKAVQIGTEKEFSITGNIFIDGTGDGTIGALAGAEYRLGRESQNEFNEENAPKKADNHTLGSTIMFKAEDMGEAIEYNPPEWAIKFNDDMLKHRRGYKKSQNFDKYWHADSSGWWWVEYGGMIDSIHDNEEIRFHLQSIVFGLWDWIKNHDKTTMEESKNYAITWISQVPGKRESRRLMGDYLLKEADLMDSRVFKDQIAVGGWSIDQHPPEGFYSKESGSHHTYMEQPYTIPYRSIYSKNVKNLLIASRCISVTHVAHASTRLIATLACVGQAAGTAASFCVKKGYSPKNLMEKDRMEYQQALIKDDQWLIGIKNQDEDDLALNAEIKSNSELPCIFGDPDRFCNVFFPMAQRFYIPDSSINEVDEIQLHLYLKNETSETIEVSGGIRCDETREEFKADKDITTFSLSLEQRYEGWVNLNIQDPESIFKKSGNYWVYLNECEGLLWGKNESRHITGFRLGYLNEQTEQWQTIRIHGSPFFDLVIGFYGHFCFKIEGISTIFPASTINNGYSRPFIGPNLWISEKIRNLPLKEVNLIKSEPKIDNNVWIDVNFKTRIELSEIWFTFDTELNNSYPHQSYSSERIKDWPIGGKCPKCIRSMDIFAVLDDEEKKIAELRDNYQRLVKIKLGKSIRAEKLKIVPKSNWGSETFSLYEIRVY